jgi:hypothetical protein
MPNKFISDQFTHCRRFGHILSEYAEYAVVASLPGKLLHGYLHVSHDTPCHGNKYLLYMAESCKLNIQFLFR